MTTKLFTKISALLLGASLLSDHFTQAAKAAPRKPNILFIFSDDQTVAAFVYMQDVMADPIDVTAALENFMNGVKASPSPATGRRIPPQRRPAEH